MAGWRRFVSQAMLNGIPVPRFLQRYATLTVTGSERPADLLQAQRDILEPFTYEELTKAGRILPYQLDR